MQHSLFIKSRREKKCPETEQSGRCLDKVSALYLYGVLKNIHLVVISMINRERELDNSWVETDMILEDEGSYVKHWIRVFQEREQQVQRPWVKKGLGVFENQKAG